MDKVKAKDLDPNTPVKLEHFAEQGREDGVRGFPPSGAEKPTGCETNIIADKKAEYIHQAGLILDEVDKIRNATEAAKDQIKALDISALKKNLERTTYIPAATIEDMKRAASAFFKATENYRLFRERLDIRREPKYSKNKEKAIKIDLLWMGIVEATAGGFFLASSVVGGWPEAMVQSLFITGFNVIGGLWAGDKYAKIPMKDKKTRIGLKTLFGTISLVFNTFMGLYREATISGNDSGFMAILGNFSSLSMESVLLILTGVIFSCIAFRNGKNYDDPIPDYKKMHLAMLEAQSKWEAMVDSVTTNLGKIITNAIEEFNILQSNIASSSSTYKSDTAKGERLFKDLKNLGEQTNDQTDNNKREYRENNLIGRNRNDPAPAYFEDYPPTITDIPSIPDWLEKETVEATKLQMETVIEDLKNSKPEFIEFVQELNERRGEEYRNQFSKIEEEASYVK
jgi:hypothetical protein